MVKAKKKLPKWHKRFSKIEPRTDVPCSLCKMIKHTTLEEVWSGADPAGRLTRLCYDCIGMFGAG